MNTLCNKISTKVFQLFGIKHFVNFHAMKIFFGAHIESLTDCGSILWDSASKNSPKHLHSLHKCSLKLIHIKQPSLEQDDYNLLNILPSHTRLKYNKGIYMQKIRAGYVPPSLTAFSQLSLLENKLRSIFLGLEFKSSLTFSGASLWNSLPLSIISRSNCSFKKHYLSCHISLP